MKECIFFLQKCCENFCYHHFFTIECFHPILYETCFSWVLVLLFYYHVTYNVTMLYIQVMSVMLHMLHMLVI